MIETITELDPKEWWIPESRGGFLPDGYDPPERIFVQGEPELLRVLPDRGLAIVGTRHPTGLARERIRSVVKTLPGSRFVLISGFARGIDSMAHEAALEVGLPTIAILAAGLDFPYPRGNEGLRKRILDQGGLLISEYSPGEAPRKERFLERNRWIAALSRAVWVAEAPSRSGALNTANWAIRFGRTVYATPALPGDPRFAGNERLLDRESAFPLWGAHSLGSTWLELATIGEAGDLANAPVKGDAAVLERERLRLKWDGAGASFQELLPWAHDRGWSTERLMKAWEEVGGETYPTTGT